MYMLFNTSSSSPPPPLPFTTPPSPPTFHRRRHACFSPHFPFYPHHLRLPPPPHPLHRRRRHHPPPLPFPRSLRLLRPPLHHHRRRRSLPPHLPHSPRRPQRLPPLLRRPPPLLLRLQPRRRHPLPRPLTIPLPLRPPPPPPSGKLITTLFQTTGRATNNFGYVNVTHDGQTNTTTVRSPATYSQPPNSATVIALIKTLPYNVTIFSVDSLIVPYGFNLLTSETRPPLGLNITKALIDGHNFNVVASILAASGVVQEFESDEGGAGITLFVPTDDAFADLPATANFQSLPADKKADVLRFHVLHSYYPLGSLQSIVNPVQPTLATEDKGAGLFTLNISRVNGSVAINTGIVQASVTQTVFDQNPVAIFGISRVLLPKEIFGKNALLEKGSPVTGAPSPITSLNFPPELYGPSSPPGSREELHSSATVRSVDFAVVCIVLVYVFV